MWNHEITLITKVKVGVDALQQPIFEEEYSKILCSKRSVTRSEFYQASQVGVRPTLVLDIHSFEYEGQELVQFEEKRYRILKTYQVRNEILELTLTEVMG